MGRANNIGRSLIIISKLQGWDPCYIGGTTYSPADGKPYAGNEYNEENTSKGFTSEQMGGLGVARNPQDATPDPAPPGPDMRGPEPRTPKNVHDPFAGFSIDGE